MVVLVTFPVWLLLGPLLCLALCLRWARRRSRPKDNARDRSDLEWELKIELPTESPDCLLGVPKESHAKEPLALPRAPLEHKFGAPRSELYKIEYYPIDEDTSSLIQAAIRDESQHQKLEEKLQQLSLLCRHFPASGWVQPQDPRVLLRPQCCDNVRHERFDSYWKASGCTGVDREGDMVVFERIGQYDVPGLLACNQEFIQKHCIYSAECVFASLELTRRRHLQQGSSRGFQLTVVADMAGLNFSFLDPRALKMCQAVARVEADHFPEVLKRIIVVRAPWIFSAVWRLCRPFLDKGSLEKVDVVKDSETTEAILRHVPPENVPKALGGKLLSADSDDYCRDLVSPGGKIPDDVIAMTWE